MTYTIQAAMQSALYDLHNTSLLACSLAGQYDNPCPTRLLSPIDYSKIPALVFWARIFKCLWGPGIDSKELIPSAYVAWRAGTITLFLLGS
jgi:hypothetical protein